MANQTELLNVSDEMKLNEKGQIIERQEHDEELCFSSSDTTEELYSSSAPDTCRMCGMDTKETYLEILCFRQFYKHFVFVEYEDGNRKKKMEKYLEVLAVVDVGCGDTKD